MAYNNYFPSTYQPNYYGANPYQVQQFPQQVPPQAMQQPVQNVQPQQSGAQSNGGFVRVQNENEARMYPVAPGNSVTFIDENAPYCYTKTMDISQLDRPKFEKYRLVKEDDTPKSDANAQNSSFQEKKENVPYYAQKSDLDAIWDEIESIKKKLQAEKKKASKKDEEDDE